MVHQCNVQCHTIDIRTAEALNIEDIGKWLPFIFTMDMVSAAKLSSDDPDSPTYGCTSLFCASGETYIIDTPYEEFFKKFIEYNNLTFNFGNEGGEDDQDNLEL